MHYAAYGARLMVLLALAHVYKAALLYKQHQDIPFNHLLSVMSFFQMFRKHELHD